MSIGKNIAQFRKDKGLTQEALGRQIGVSNQAVSKWESDTTMPDVMLLPKIAEQLGVSLEELYGIEPNDHAASAQKIKRPAHKGMESLRNLYRIGVGPSSSHTMGPEKISRIFQSRFPNAERYQVILYGSLALTGRGHGTDRAIQKVFGDRVEVIFDDHSIDIEFPNTMDLLAFQNGRVERQRAYSLGGGAIAFAGEPQQEALPYTLTSFYDISESVKSRGMRIYDYVRECEGDEIFDDLADVWRQMKASIKEGTETEGILPGGLGVERKARFLLKSRHIGETDVIRENRLISAYAFAVSEQNAAGGVIVTAPTCGSCGVMPAVLFFMQQKYGFSDAEICNALATGGIIGNLIKTNASISGAECGCQAEIGSACAMAAAALAELYELNLEQIEYASEIAIEHHLGLTCDPVKGLVQIPCIERNAVAAMRAINAVTLSNFLAKTRNVSFDTIVETMYETGKDLYRGYRETSVNGLAKFYVNNDPNRTNDSVRI